LWWEFDLFIGIDYSGAKTATARLKGLQVCVTRPGKLPQKKLSRTAANGQPCNWTRSEAWLIELSNQRSLYRRHRSRVFVPQSYFDRYKLTNWLQFLDDFMHHWPTDRDHLC
jgi:hypothetical protein